MQIAIEQTQIDLNGILNNPDPSGMRPRQNTLTSNDLPIVDTLDDWLFNAARDAVQNRAPIVLEHAIQNTDRTVGARIAGEIAKLYGDAGLPSGTIRVNLRGSAGQSFGAFCINGLHLTVTGEANDYVGKGMAGGEIVIRLPENARYASNENTIFGNTVLYGATGGAFFAAGTGGERCAVRNSGATAVVEGVGDHACEYMTGGAIVVLGQTGRNFAAGMTGGVAYVYDATNTLANRLNPTHVTIQRMSDDTQLRDLVSQHAEKTGSQWSRSLLERWSETRHQFWQIVPK